MRHHTVLLLLAGCFHLTGVSAADIVPSTSLPPEGYVAGTTVGVDGGIPSGWSTSTTLTTSATASQIESACNSAANDTVVVLGAGTYNLTGNINITNDRVILRGAVDAYGVPTTILNFSSGASGWGLIDLSKTSYPDNNWSAVSDRTISSGAARGSTSVTLSSAPTGLGVGQVLFIDALEDGTNISQNGSSEGGGYGRDTNRPYMQAVIVTAINSATVTFAPALSGQYWGTSGITPGAWWWGTGLTGSTVSRVGLENLKIVRSNGGGGSNNIAIGPAANCWLKNVWSQQAYVAHVRIHDSYGIEVRDGWYTLHDSVASATYSIDCQQSSNVLIENNVFYNIPCAMGLRSCTNLAVMFNYASVFPYQQSNWLPECMMTHGGHDTMLLIEGNRVPSWWSDYTHGNASYLTIARNRITGWESGKTDSTRAVNAEQKQWAFAVVGNVLGTDSYHNAYEAGTYTSVYNTESGSRATWTRKGNYNTVDDAVPSSESLAGSTVADSYLYSGSSRPEHWGAEPWPWVDTSNYSQSITDTNFPAGYRFADANHAWPAESADTTDPTVTITSPTSSSTYDNGTSTSFSIGGTASDDVALSSVTVAMTGATTGSVSVSGTTSWSGSTTLNVGDTTLTATATDSSSNTATDSITVTVHAPSAGGASPYLFIFQQ